MPSGTARPANLDAVAAKLEANKRSNAARRTEIANRRSTGASAVEAVPKSRKDGKPSVAGSTAAGAAGGAALGPAGTAGGAVLGAVTGQKKKSEWKRANRPAGTQALVAEFIVCMLILGLSPLVAEVDPKDFMKRGTAICALFVILGMTSSIGPKTSRAMVAFGGLVVLVLLIDQRSVFGVIAQKLGSVGDGAPEVRGEAE